MKPLVIGILPQAEIRARALAIASGKYKPRPGEPKIWFTSMRSVAEVLSDQNRALLKIIRETNPDSLAVLARLTGRQPGNLSRTLKTMSRYGLVELRREKSQVRPIVKAQEIRIVAAA
jgi:predicted transcriptional regulator